MADSGSMNGSVGEHGVVFDGLRQLEDLEQLEGARGEDRQAVRALGVQAAGAELGLEALEVGAQRRLRGVAETVLVAHPARRSIEQRAHLGAARRGGRELARIEVDEQRQHLGVARADPREATQALGGDVVGLHAPKLLLRARDSPAAHTRKVVVR